MRFINISHPSSIPLSSANKSTVAEAGCGTRAHRPFGDLACEASISSSHDSCFVYWKCLGIQLFFIQSWYWENLSISAVDLTIGVPNTRHSTGHPESRVFKAKKTPTFWNRCQTRLSHRRIMFSNRGTQHVWQSSIPATKESETLRTAQVYKVNCSSSPLPQWSVL